MKDVICHLDVSGLDQDTLVSKVTSAWSENYGAYHIFNVSRELNAIEMYEELAESLGKIRLCHPVNNKETKFSKSRDVKYQPGVNHYFASNSRQPLHTDYAYYESTEAPDWLMLYCIEPSEFGGKTHLLSLQTLKLILEKYAPELLAKIKVDVTWKYNGKDGDKVHQKPIYDGKSINWNYWQIKEELNTPEIMQIREEFFGFLEDVIVGGSMYDFSKIWSPGDCLIFNDRVNMHGRDAFLGDRWLKDHAFYRKKTR